MPNRTFHPNAFAIAASLLCTATAFIMTLGLFDARENLAITACSLPACAPHLA